MVVQRQFKETHGLKKNFTDINIVSYKPEYKSKFKQLNYEWLTRFFEVEPADEKILSSPEEEILNKNGHIFFALFDNEVIGTCTLMKRDETSYELSKMCVTKQYQGMGAGKKLLDEAISTAYELGAKNIVLLTNTKLTAAYNLYVKTGFKVIHNPPMKSSTFKRTSTCTMMSLDLMSYINNQQRSLK